MKFKLKCCGKLLTTRTDLFKHYEVVPREGETRQMYFCNTHGEKHIKGCQDCFNAAFIDRAERTLDPKKMFDKFA